MAYTTAELIEAIQDRAELDANSSLTTAAYMLRLLNRALAQVSLEANWPWLRSSASVSSVAGTPTLVLPTGWLRTMSLTDNEDGTPMDRRPARILDRLVDSGRPQLYAAEGGVLTLGPTPDAVYTYTHRYLRSEPTLTAGGTPLIPEAYSQGVVEWAAIKAFQKTTAGAEKVTQAILDYRDWVTRTRDNINQGADPLRVEPREGAWF
jgi:hypothetical protein